MERGTESSDGRLNSGIPERAPVSIVLLATDGSPSAKPAEALACVLAKTFHAKLDVVRVLEFEPWRDRAYRVNQLYLEDRGREIRQQMHATADEIMAKEVIVTCHEAVGLPSQEIIARASALRSDLLVLGTHGRTGLDHLLIGSTAERVVRGAPCPVVTVRGSMIGTGPPPPAISGMQTETLSRLLVPMDFSDGSREALEYAVQFGAWFGSAILLLHVVEPVAYGLDFTLTHAASGVALRAELERSMEDLVVALERRGLRARHEIVPGFPAEVISRMAENRSSEAIIMGTHGRRGWSKVRFGSVAESVVRQAHCPVFTVRNPKFHSVSGEDVSSRPEPSARATG